MSETKFTPGPWTVHYGNETNKARSVDPVLRWDALLQSKQPSEANAHMIAAAPDLYEALKRAEPALWLVAASGNADAVAIHAECLAALAKARGEA